MTSARDDLSVPLDAALRVLAIVTSGDAIVDTAPMLTADMDDEALLDLIAAYGVVARCALRIVKAKKGLGHPDHRATLYAITTTLAAPLGDALRLAVAASGATPAHVVEAVSLRLQRHPSPPKPLDDDRPKGDMT